MKKTQYLLTGAAGNLGSSVARQLVAEGRAVRALVLKGDPAAERVPREVELMVGDVTDIASLDRFFSDDKDTELVVIHCASIVTVSPDYSQKVYDVNVTGTKNIVDKCVERKARKLVYISSTGAITEPPRGQRIAEPTLFDPDSVVGFYGKTKAEATQIVLKASAERGLDASIVYPSGIAGPGDYAYGPVASFVIDYCQGKMGAGIAGSFNAVDVRDLAAGVIACCDRGRRGEGYVMANARVSIEEMFHLLSERTGTKEVKRILPVPLAYAIAWIAGVAGRISGKQGRFTTFAVYNLARNNDFSCEKAQRELGYKVRPFEETIADLIAWLRAERKI